MFYAENVNLKLRAAQLLFDYKIFRTGAAIYTAVVVARSTGR
jgi:hypothetical protein